MQFRFISKHTQLTNTLMDVRSEESGGASAHAQHGHGDDEEQHDLTGEQWVKMWEEFEEEFTISFVDP